MKRLIASLLAYATFLTASADAGGLMGCSYDQCVAAFGNPVGHTSGELHKGSGSYDIYFFQQQAWSYAVLFVREQAIVIRYSKIDETPLTSDETNPIFAAYSDGQEWQSSPRAGYFSRRDYGAMIKKSMTKIVIIGRGGIPFIDLL